MRFNDYLQHIGATARPVNQFSGLRVEVGTPADWEPYDAALGGRVWICRSDVGKKRFCANAVLTMHQVNQMIAPDEVFSLLSDQQLELVLGAEDLGRTLVAAGEGPGVIGTMKLRIAHELGMLDSVSTTRILAAEGQMLIAQLTVTALDDVGLEGAHTWLRIDGSVVESHVGLTPIARPTGGSNGFR